MTDAPSIIDCLCAVCDTEFKILKTTLDRLDVNYEVDKRLVRGLDYYTRATFEIQTGSLGAQSAVAGGGRYDGLVKLLGGPDTPATGFAIGFDRLAEIVQMQAADLQRKPDVYIAAMGAQSQAQAFDWVCELGQQGYYIEMDHQGRSLKSQMKRANRLEAPYVIMLGENELSSGTAMLRDMTSKEQTEIPLDQLVQAVIQRVQKK